MPTAVYLDIDKTLFFGDTKNNISTVNFEQVNTELLRWLHNQGLTEIYLFSDMYFIEAVVQNRIELINLLTALDNSLCDRDDLRVVLQRITAHKPDLNMIKRLKDEIHALMLDGCANILDDIYFANLLSFSESLVKSSYTLSRSQSCPSSPLPTGKSSFIRVLTSSESITKGEYRLFRSQSSDFSDKSDSLEKRPRRFDF